ncbi:mRNA-decapping enzyme subunit 2-like [Nymphaea colorata]|nr:mRNA-decapping enzyme subunit 2-like [Nymphaea colorata]
MEKAPAARLESSSCPPDSSPATFKSSLPCPCPRTWFNQDAAPRYRVHLFPQIASATIVKKTTPDTDLLKGWKAGASWSFPLGKKNKDEEDHTCAIREVLEKTGFDISKLLKLEDNIEVVIGQQRMRLYIIAGVKKDTVFAPLTKKKISGISWHRLDELQPAGNDVISRGSNGLKLFMVAPVLMPVKAWMSAHYPTGQKFDVSVKGATCWKAKASSTGRMSDAIPSITGVYGHTNAHLTVISPIKIFRKLRI